MIGPVSLRGIENSGEGRGYHDAAYRGGKIFDGVKNRGCTDDGGIEKIFLGVGHVEVELQVTSVCLSSQ